MLFKGAFGCTLFLKLPESIMFSRVGCVFYISPSQSLSGPDTGKSQEATWVLVKMPGIESGRFHFFLSGPRCSFTHILESSDWFFFLFGISCPSHD